MDCIRRFAPENYDRLSRIGKAWGTDEQQDVLEAVYPDLPKNSVDFAIMEPAGGDDQVGVATVPMDVQWLDVGSWEAFAETLKPDDNRNAVAAERTVMLDTEDTLITSNDPNHLIATIGVENLVIVHTPHATLICDRDHTQRVKEMQQQVARDHGEGYV
jgi:mannose-1-phosphate guanylyltransferase